MRRLSLRHWAGHCELHLAFNAKLDTVTQQTADYWRKRIAAELLDSQPTVFKSFRAQMNLVYLDTSQNVNPKDTAQA